MSILKFGYVPVNLNDFTELEEKFETVFNFLEILAVFCELNDKYDPDSNKIKKDLVKQIEIPGGSPTHIQSLIWELREILIKSVDDFIETPKTHLYDLVQTLKTLKKLCIRHGKFHDTTDTIENALGKIIFLAYQGNQPFKLYFDHLALSPSAKTTLTDHFYVRKKFYESMTETLDMKIDDLNEVPPYGKQPYEWNTEKSHYEIAELLYALIVKRIKIKEGKKGSYAKLVKNFYNVFGLDESLYYAKLQQIENRKKKESWLRELVEFIDDVQKRNNHAKK